MGRCLSAAGAQEKEIVVHFINEVGERWRSVSVELQCLRSMLEEVSAHTGPAGAVSGAQLGRPVRVVMGAERTPDR